MRLCVTLVDRANYGRLVSVMRAIQSAPGLTLQVVVGGSMVLPRCGDVAQQVRAEFPVHAEVWHEVEGSKHYTMALACGNGTSGYATEYRRLAPDMVILIGDRYEALAAANAAHLMNIPILHFQGGETSECVDHRTRNAITQMAQWHVPATQQAAQRVAEMTGKPESILTVGCPSSDLAFATEFEADEEDNRPIGPLLAAFHPNTTEPADYRAQVGELLKALAGVPHKVDMLWPNIDPGSHDMHMELRKFLKKPRDWLTMHKSMAPEAYMSALANTRCCVGNSSSFVRDASFFGTPVVLVGNRQRGREHGGNVIEVPCESKAIVEALQTQLEHGRYGPSDLYGDGAVSSRVVAALQCMAQDQEKVA